MKFQPIRSTPGCNRERNRCTSRPGATPASLATSGFRSASIAFVLPVNRWLHSFRAGDLDPGVLKTDTLFDAQGNQLGLIESMVQYWNGAYGLDYRIYPDSIVNITGSDTSRYFWRFSSTGLGRLTPGATTWFSITCRLDQLSGHPATTASRTPTKPWSSFTCSDKVITVAATPIVIITPTPNLRHYHGTRPSSGKPPPFRQRTNTRWSYKARHHRYRHGSLSWQYRQS